VADDLSLVVQELLTPESDSGRVEWWSARRSSAAWPSAEWAGDIQEAFVFVYQETPSAFVMAQQIASLDRAIRRAVAAVQFAVPWEDIPDVDPIPSSEGLRLEAAESGSLTLVFAAGRMVYHVLTSRPADFVFALLTVLEHGRSRWNRIVRRSRPPGALAANVSEDPDGTLRISARLPPGTTLIVQAGDRAVVITAEDS